MAFDRLLGQEPLAPLFDTQDEEEVQVCESLCVGIHPDQGTQEMVITLVHETGQEREYLLLAQALQDLGLVMYNNVCVLKT